MGSTHSICKKSRTTPAARSCRTNQNLDTTFNTLIEHLRTRYNLAFVSSNKKRDGTLRKLKIDLAPATKKSQTKLVVKARKSYVAPKG